MKHPHRNGRVLERTAPFTCDDGFVDDEQKRSMLARLLRGCALAVPGVHDAVSATIAQQAGFPLLYVGSDATSAVWFGRVGGVALTMNEMVDHAASIAEAVSVPVIADASHGWADYGCTWRTVVSFERAGLAGIHIDDRSFCRPARARPILAPIEIACARIEEAVAARTDPGFVIIARTDAPSAGADMDETMRRAERYARAGADLVMPAGLRLADAPVLRAHCGRPLVIVHRAGQAFAAQSESGVSLVLHGALTLEASCAASKAVLRNFRESLEGDAVSPAS